jgi:organic hydroperoxide reductase OsmC/OhrA
MSDFRFPVELSWPGGRRVVATAPGKPSLEIATPVELKGEWPDRWSPEDVLVAAVASCYAVTLVAIASRTQTPMHELAIRAEGTVGREGREPFGFKTIRLDVTATTDAGCESELAAATERAEAACIVSNALRIPVSADVTIRVAASL